MKKIIILFIALSLQACLKTYELTKSENTTTLTLNDIYLPHHKGLGSLLVNIETTFTIQGANPECPFDGSILAKNHLGDIKLTKSNTSKTINIKTNESSYISYVITEVISNVTNSCKSSLRLDPELDKEYRLSVDSNNCNMALYEAQKGKNDFIRSDNGARGQYRDERLCL